MASDLRFEEPPVREVSLTVFFERVATLQSLNLAQLRVDWKDAYPKVSEVPPRPPLRGDTPMHQYLGGNSFWPMPLTAFTNARGDQTIELQNDRFGIVWRFHQGPKTYPGYDELSTELLLRFEDFRRAISNSLAQELNPTDSYVSYTNLIEGVLPESLAVGILTNWQTSLARLDPPELAGLRLHYCSPELEEDVALTIMVDPSFDRDRDRDDPCASLELEGSISLDDSLAIDQSLAIAHDAVVKKFLELTSNDMKTKWGLRSEDF
ncbi:TIGR04255 family protein [Verrucosispora sp. NA02020]|uniref:TIGR04255 family protein n=1 Tax=Verrucosispora sp. NA02020 TaxID=2742132 RepID=UPI001592AE4F|nr:TIGR04255 family protein [Verrucosispora sp. NA02020]QKW11802.1 TIGR04255 family protein [Verrucosispora sp. NA02020]